MTGRGLAVGGALLLGCSGVLNAEPQRVSATLLLTNADPANREEVAAAVRALEADEPAHAAKVTSRVVGDDHELVLVIERSSAALAAEACDSAVEAALQRQLEVHRAGIAKRRSEIGDQIGQATDPAAQVELRRQLEDLAAQRDRNDLRVTSPCAPVSPSP